MKNKTLQDCLPKRYKYDILKELSVTIDIDSNPFQIPMDTLFLMAARNNEKRGFLFVSKVLGKHIPVSPYTPLLAAAALGVQYMKVMYNMDFPQTKDIMDGLIRQKNMDEIYQKIKSQPIILPQPTIFIGFAETATALGHGMFDCFGNDGVYIHTTREEINGRDSIIEFEEEHSHATTHRFYPMDDRLLSSENPVVLVDDEITTGKTALNIIKAIQKIYPRKEYVVASLLDWRTEDDRKRFEEMEESLNIKIHSVSLVSGTIKVLGEPVAVGTMEKADAEEDENDSEVVTYELWKEKNIFDAIPFSSVNSKGHINHSDYLRETGRFAIATKDKKDLDEKCSKIGEFLKEKRIGKRTLCLGNGEFMYIPMKISAHMGDGVLYHSTTRSPIRPWDQPAYGAKNTFKFKSSDDPFVIHYLYNIPHDYYDEVFLFLERDIPKENLKPVINVLKNVGIPKINIIIFMGDTFKINEPTPMGSYDSRDVVFLLKDISSIMNEKGTVERERAIQRGTHYSEMLPIEYNPSPEYMDLFYSSLRDSAEKLGEAVGVVSEKIMKNRGKDMVLVSLARAGTPVGILIKRYLSYKYHIDIPHYSVSIIRGKGIDENAIRYILRKHPDKNIQFVDGWTGKGAITKVLKKSCEELRQKYGIDLDDDLAVLADPGYCVSTFGTRDDFLIASACLNGTVSGLVSRTVHRDDLIGAYDFHGAKYYEELKGEDVSSLFIDTITEQFPLVEDKVKPMEKHMDHRHTAPTWSGWKDIEEIQREFDIKNVNYIKPGIGETTRVLLRRVPWKILIKDENNPNLAHILLLARDRNVTVEVYPNMTYQCCGLIKNLRGK